MKRVVVLVLVLCIGVSMVTADPVFDNGLWKSLPDTQRRLFIIGGKVVLDWLYETDVLFQEMTESEKQYAKGMLFNISEAYSRIQSMKDNVTIAYESNNYSNFNDIITAALILTMESIGKEQEVNEK